MAKFSLATTDVATEARPRIITALGKQTRGKTILLRYLAERPRTTDRPLKLLDADPHNPTLDRYFDGVLTPGSVSLEDRRVWIEQQIRDQRDAARRGEPFDTVLDLGGGDHLVAKLAHDVRFTETLDKMGIDLVVFYLLGPSISDLEYFQSLEDAGFEPKRLGLVFNCGLVTAGRAPVKAFGEVINAPLTHLLTERGAKLFHMPALESDCMDAVDRSGARTFREAIAKLEDWDEMRLQTWLDQSMEKQVAKPLADLGWLV